MIISDFVYSNKDEGDRWNKMKNEKDIHQCVLPEWGDSKIGDNLRKMETFVK